MNDKVLFDIQQGITDLMDRAKKRFLSCPDMTLDEAERIGTVLATIQRDVNFWIGDLARYARHRWPDTHHQVWPEWISPGLVDRCTGTCSGYPSEADRQIEATYTVYREYRNDPRRQQLIAETVEKGLTSDEAREARKASGKPGITTGSADSGQGGPRWILAIDCNYFLHRFWHSGAGVEAATSVASWIERTVERLKDKGLTDVACCFDSHTNHRKELTKDWEHRYKDRPPKDLELGQQLTLVRELLDKAGFAIAQSEGWEADDVMASIAKQFDGRITLLTQDKDQRQCLSAKCNILLDVQWNMEEHTGDMVPDYKWLTAKEHTETTGITPLQWPEYQAIMGDNVDGIRGAEGIGKKGAADLIQQFGSARLAIDAAKAGDESIRPKKRESLIEFAERLEITRQLVTLRDDLEIPNNTKIV